MLTDEIRAAFVTMRDEVFSFSRMTVYHASGEYLGIYSPMTQDDSVESIGTPGRATGNVRLNTSDLVEPMIKPGDSIEVLEPGATEAVPRVVISIRNQQGNATVYITYGVKYG